MSEENSGYIYVAHSASFPNSVKIGYSRNVEKRMKEIAGQTPAEFTPVLTYKVNGNVKDNKIHSIIKGFNPSLQVKGENYFMSPEQAITIFKNLAEISETQDNLSINYKPARQRHHFSFHKCGIPSGSKLKFINNNKISVTVINDRYVEYNKQKTTLSVLATELLGAKKIVKGENYFTYNNRILASY